MEGGERNAGQKEEKSHQEENCQEENCQEENDQEESSQEEEEEIVPDGTVRKRADLICVSSFFVDNYNNFS